MAHLALSVDSSPERRQLFAGRVQQQLETLPKLVIEHFECGDLIVVIARNPNAPHSQWTEPGRFACLVGEAIDPRGSRLDAKALSEAWKRPASVPPPGGYFAGMAYSPEEGLTLGGDLAGIFPLYYAQAGTAVVAGSSPELVAAHPGLRSDMDFEGLAGLLLINSFALERTLVSGVRRLAPGHHLRWSSGEPPTETEFFSLRTVGTEPMSLDEACELSVTELRRTLRQHRPGTPSTLMLSGGLDSRLLAALLHSEQITDSGLILGRTTDLEAQVGTRVARALGWNIQQVTREPDPKEFTAAGRHIAKWEHLASGFSHLESIASADAVGATAPRFWSGFVLENLMGSDWYQPDAPGRPKSETFEAAFASMNTWALPEASIVRLLRPAISADQVSRLVTRLKEQYRDSATKDPLRATMCRHTYRARFHVGTVLHRLSFRSWPVLPLLDAQFIRTQMQIPFELKIGRRIQKELLLRLNPALAEIPREHNSFWLEPIRETRWTRAAASCQRRLRRWYWQKWVKDEPRRYYRCYNLNSPQWRAVREAVDALRVRAGSWLDPDTLGALLPPANATLQFREPISGSGASRLLLGLLLWSARS